MDHLAEARIPVLEQFRDTKEKGGGFIGRELLPSVEEESNLGKKYSASSWLNGGAVEKSGWSNALAVGELGWMG
jgi:hypothetical protein